MQLVKEAELDPKPGYFWLESHAFYLGHPA